MSAPDIAGLRGDYSLKTLDESEVDRDPLKQFGVWMVEAIHAQVPEPTAMSLSTVGANGRPAGRIVLLKGVDPRGFVFYTNYASRKARELESNPRAALVFYWRGLGRQVRVEGRVERVAREEAETYWRSRPAASRLSATASRQSEPVESREELERAVERVRAEHGDEPPLPEHWGGYRVVPDAIEFWIHDPARLHDRFQYRRSGDEWTVERLQP